MTKWSKLLLLLFLLFVSAYITIPAAAATEVILIPGARGNLVRTVQNYLHQLNYLKPNPTGYYGAMTREAVKSFQLEHGLAASGVTDNETFTSIQQAYTEKNNFTEYTVTTGETLVDIAAKFNTSIVAIMVNNNLAGNEVSAGRNLIIPAVNNGVRTTNSRSRIGLIQSIPWSIVNLFWKNGEIARIIDVDTGKSFQVKRLYGYFHADIEPLTRYDTQIFKEIYGGHWSWSRRAVIVQLHNLYIAASVNGMPHGGRSIYNNNFPGQFCAHFLGSRVHKNSRVDPDHQAMIDKAATAMIPPESVTDPEANEKNDPGSGMKVQTTVVQ